MRRVLIPAALLAAGLAAWWWLAPAVATPGPRLRTASVDRGPITAVVAATGTVNPSLSVQVSSQLSGNVRELFADFNTRVTRGQPLARLDTATNEAKRAAAAADHRAAEAQVAVTRAQADKAEADRLSAEAAIRSSQAQIVRAEAVLADAEADARRKTDLRQRGVGSVSEAERAVYTARQASASLAAARAQLAQSEAAATAAGAAARTVLAQVEAAVAVAAQKAAVLRQVEVDLENSWIRAPIDGTVISRTVDIGQTVASSLQAPVLFQIAGTLTEMEIWATVDEADIGRIRRGQEASFTVSAFPGRAFHGVVKDIRLAPATVQNVVTYTVVVTAPNEEQRLLPGMTATLRVVTDAREAALRVPNAALRYRPPGAGAETAAAPGGNQVEQALAALPDLTETQRAELLQAQAAFRAALDAAEGDARRLVANQARQRLIARLNAVLTPAQRARLAGLRGGQGGQAGTVWVVTDDAAPRAVRVRTGMTDGSVTEIVAGDLVPGAAVVVGQERAAAPSAAPGGPRL